MIKLDGRYEERFMRQANSDMLEKNSTVGYKLQQNLMRCERARRCFKVFMHKLSPLTNSGILLITCDAYRLETVTVSMKRRRRGPAYMHTYIFPKSKKI